MYPCACRVATCRDCRRDVAEGPYVRCVTQGCSRDRSRPYNSVNVISVCKKQMHGFSVCLQNPPDFRFVSKIRRIFGAFRYGIYETMPHRCGGRCGLFCFMIVVVSLRVGTGARYVAFYGMFVEGGGAGIRRSCAFRAGAPEPRGRGRWLPRRSRPLWWPPSRLAAL